MQRDMHFYGVYALARAAGIRPEMAHTVAYASQFVDDSVHDDPVSVGGRMIFPDVTAHRALDARNFLPAVQWKVWVPFHFLPGGMGDTAEERLVCRQDTSISHDALQWVLSLKKSWAPHALGIFLHAYADTFSHYGFSGVATRFNAVAMDDTRLILASSDAVRTYLEVQHGRHVRKLIEWGVSKAFPGHWPVGHYPDLPFATWQYTPAMVGNRDPITRKNPSDFLQGAKKLYQVFLKVRETWPTWCIRRSKPRKWGDLRPTVTKLIRHVGRLEDREGDWKKALKAGAFGPVRPLDRRIGYDEELWTPEQATYRGSDAASEDDLLRFSKAATQFRGLILHRLLPRFELGMPEWGGLA